MHLVWTGIAIIVVAALVALVTNVPYLGLVAILGLIVALVGVFQLLTARRV